MAQHRRLNEHSIRPQNCYPYSVFGHTMRGCFIGSHSYIRIIRIFVCLSIKMRPIKRNGPRPKLETRLGKFAREPDPESDPLTNSARNVPLD